MSGGRRNVTASSAIGSARIDDVSEGRSRPSKTNCTSGDTRPETPESESGQSVLDEWWRRKNDIVDRFVEEQPRRAVRPISVRGGTKLRDEAAREKFSTGEGEERYRSQPWSAVLDEFLSWYNDYRDAELVYGSPEGEEVRADMENSHMPQYGNRYYARIKAFERQIVKSYDDPHSVMLTFSGSSANDNGGWRCPADHLRDVIESWRPKRGRGVYHALRDVLEGKEWEYVIVVEKHRSGYGHVHCGVFVDGRIEEEDLHRVIDTHLRRCGIAGRDAHDYYSPDSEDRPISVNRIDPGNADEGSIGNLGSYIGEYIGAYGDELFERGLDDADMGECRLLERNGSWYLHVTATRDVEKRSVSDPTDRLPVGVDIGDAALATVCHREERGTPTAPDIYSDEASQVRHLRKTYFTATRRLQRRESERIVEEYADSLWERIDHIIHRVSRQVVERAQQVEQPVLVLENLRHIRENMDYGAFMNRRLHGWAFAKLHAHIQYKAQEAGIPVATVTPRNTSKECHNCGEIGTRPQQATFRCRNDECWVSEYQADVNAALTIADRYRSGESQPQPDRDPGQKAPSDDSATDGASLTGPQDSHSEDEIRPATSGPHAS